MAMIAQRKSEMTTNLVVRNVDKDVALALKQIATIELIHDLTVVTGNICDFRGTGVVLKNPFL